MGNPTYGGLLRLQHYFEATRFPLTDFRINVCPQTLLYACGLEYQGLRFSEGTEGDLSHFAARAPRIAARNVALCRAKEGYGIRFVTGYFRDACAFNKEHHSGDLVSMHAYGHPDFVDYVRAYEDELYTMARYGNASPTFIDRVKLHFFPSCYSFPAIAG